ncbi:sensory neuron membrane protein 2-like isoform X2 [Athalia rosae]|uniref:sensory neuron membrane protein 2-like isoform X2 n=1 Tax=Athalia rosae TaxID=37344 RepID=UPI0020332BAB|nr:sensory neuron membrane protein 2-like isoform X2 [Athalia rosae]
MNTAMQLLLRCDTIFNVVRDIITPGNSLDIILKKADSNYKTLQFIQDCSVMRGLGSPSYSMGFGIAFVIVGTIAMVIRVSNRITEHVLDSASCLKEGSLGFKLWKTVDLQFKAYLFNVANPTEVQEKGDAAILVEYGPYVYDEHIEKIVIGVDESTDTIEYMVLRTLFFNGTKSGNLSETDEVTILNPAYLGIIHTLANMFPAFVGRFGNSIPLLFPDSNSIFVKGQVKDILFDGLPLICDSATHRELNLICSFLKTKRPPILRTTPDAGVYAYSFFNKINSTTEGPYTAFRGTKDRYRAGDLSKFKGSAYSDDGSMKNCSIIKGSDSLYWPPIKSRESTLFSFISDLCSGLMGHRYSPSENMWNGSDSSCYCTMAPNGSANCPTRGLLDLTKCQGAPILMSWPHFLYGAESILSSIRGIRPDPKKHAAYVIIEPLTGTPLVGTKKMQLNMILQQQQVRLLANVSRAVFPLVWVDEGLTVPTKLLAPIVVVHRVRRVLEFITWILLLFGILLIVHSCWMNAGRRYIGGSSGGIILPPENTLN